MELPISWLNGFLDVDVDGFLRSISLLRTRADWSDVIPGTL